jgi:hypothetical protein
MATVLEVCTIGEQHSIVCFLWAKGLNAKNIHKKICPVYDLKCMSRKAFTNWVANISLMMMRLKWKVRK